MSNVVGNAGIFLITLLAADTVPTTIMYYLYMCNFYEQIHVF